MYSIIDFFKLHQTYKTLLRVTYILINEFQKMNLKSKKYLISISINAIFTCPFSSFPSSFSSMVLNASLCACSAGHKKFDVSLEKISHWIKLYFYDTYFLLKHNGWLICFASKMDKKNSYEGIREVPLQLVN